MTPRNVTGLVDALVETGFVTRGPHPTDRRATLVSLTAHGAEVAAGLAAGRVAFAEALFAEMSDRRFAALVERARGPARAAARRAGAGGAMRTLAGWLAFAWRFEVALYRSLVRWATRRPAVPAGATAGAVRRCRQPAAVGLHDRLGRGAGRPAPHPPVGARPPRRGHRRDLGAGVDARLHRQPLRLPAPARSRRSAAPQRAPPDRRRALGRGGASDQPGAQHGASPARCSTTTACSPW